MALNPIMLVVVALAALVGMLVAAYFRFESVRNIVDSVWQKIQAWANWLWNYLGPALVAIWDGIVATFTAVLTFFQEDFIPLVQEVAETVVEIWQAIADFFTDNFLPAVIAVADAVTVAFRALADFFMVYVWPIITTAFDAINSVVQNFWDVIMSVYDLVRALFSGDFKEVWFKFRDMIGEVLQFVVDLFVMLPLKIWDAARPLIGKFALIVSDFAVFLVGKIVKLIQSIPDQIVEFISGIATDILNIGKDIGGWIIDGLVAAIKGAAGAVADAVRAIIPDVGSIASGVAGSVGGWFKGLVPGLATGGIVTSPTLALIGEAGPEAVVPLDRLHGGGGSTFNITVNAGLGTDGRQVGTQIVSALKQWERSNGSLPLSVSAV
jgi:phage-related protein